MDITYNVDDEVDEIYLEDALYESTTNIVWVAGSPSTITTVVATK
jgi:hypothetical protein